MFDFNVCIALDESSSIELRSQGGTPGNYDDFIKPFAQELVEELRDVAAITSTTFQSSIVEFNQTAVVSSPLTDDPDLTIANINNLEWDEGNTNHEDAILKCQSTLPTPSSGAKNFIVLLTDGDPNVCASDACARTNSTGACPLSNCVPAQNAATNAATIVKNDGTIMLPVFIERPPNFFYTPPPQNETQAIIDYMNDLSSEGFDVPVSNFTGLGEIVLDIKQEILCGGF